MTKEHVCRERPGFRKNDDPWVDGPVSSCPYHGQKITKPGEVKGIVNKAQLDREAGVIGSDSGHGYYD